MSKKSNTNNSKDARLREQLIAKNVKGKISRDEKQKLDQLNEEYQHLLGDIPDDDVRFLTKASNKDK